MGKRLLVLAFGLVSAFSVHAANTIDLGASTCSGTETTDTTFGLFLSCSGDFSLSTGSLTSDGNISLTALGNLSLSDFSISASNITINAVNVDIAASVSLTGQTVNIAAGGVLLDNGQIITTSGGSITGGGSTTTSGGTLTIGGSIGEPITINGPSDGTIGVPVLNGGANGDITGNGGTIVCNNCGSIDLGNSGNFGSPIVSLQAVPLPAAFFSWMSGGLLILMSIARRSVDSRLV